MGIMAVNNEMAKNINAINVNEYFIHSDYFNHTYEVIRIFTVAQSPDVYKHCQRLPLCRLTCDTRTVIYAISDHVHFVRKSSNQEMTIVPMFKLMVVVI